MELEVLHLAESLRVFQGRLVLLMPSAEYEKFLRAFSCISGWETSGRSFKTPSQGLVTCMTPCSHSPEDLSDPGCYRIFRVLWARAKPSDQEAIERWVKNIQEIFSVDTPF
jgi:hypothetical protein